MSGRAAVRASAIVLAVVATGLWIGLRGGPRTNALGPLDGWDLPPTDLARVAVGTSAPDFSLRALSGDTVALSDFRGERNVVLVFYRGHW